MRLYTALIPLLGSCFAFLSPCSRKLHCTLDCNFRNELQNPSDVVINDKSAAVSSSYLDYQEILDLDGTPRSGFILDAIGTYLFIFKQGRMDPETVILAWCKVHKGTFDNEIEAGIISTPTETLHPWKPYKVQMRCERSYCTLELRFSANSEIQGSPAIFFGNSYEQRWFKTAWFDGPYGVDGKVGCLRLVGRRGTAHIEPENGLY